MRYSGGKGHIGKYLSPVILSYPHQRIIEPFCGGLSMSVLLQPAICSDASRPLINLLTAVRAGWSPPLVLSEERYKELQMRRSDIDDPEVVYAGFCGSWGGKWWGGYARSHQRQIDPVGAARRKLLERMQAISQTEILHADYQELPYVSGDVVYCDPPYAGTTDGYAGTGVFDHDAFWDWARRCVERNITVIVSEYTAPLDFDFCFSIKHVQQLRRKDSARRVEHLWIHESL